MHIIVVLIPEFMIEEPRKDRLCDDKMGTENLKFEFNSMEKLGLVIVMRLNSIIWQSLA